MDQEVQHEPDVEQFDELDLHDNDALLAKTTDDAPATPPTAESLSSTATSEPPITMPSHQLRYRPDIDGLRTLAVVPVLLFHAYPDTFPSGFIGVDIFFVISGYLISGILLKECKARTFTYYGFYSRRLRRIFPILLLVMTTTLWMGCLYLLAASLQALAATMLAGSLFCANLQVLSLEKGYFDDDIKSNPLLHLWSLGVEEQFYIFWPFLASVVARLSFRRAVVVQGIVLVVSFVANVAFLGYHGSNKFAFYFPLCRFWQMSIGGLLAYLHFHDPSSSSPAPSNALSSAGLAMIVAGFFLIDETSVFPGFWAILPSCGAALLIGAGPTAAFNASILSAAPVVYVGKISYALYLWHWPLLVFAKVRFPNAAFRPFYMQPYMMLLVAVACSINFVAFENRIRRVKSKWIVPGLFVLMLGVSAVSLSVYLNPASFSLTELDLQQMEGPQDLVVADVTATLAPPHDIMAQVSPSSTVGSIIATGQNNSATSTAPAKDLVSATTSAPAKELPNPSREKRVQTTSYLQAIQGGKDMNTVWEKGLSFLNASSPYGYHPHAQVLNPDHEANGLVVVLGDSHADMTKPRFLKLFEDAAAAGQPFPTIVFKTEYGRAPLSCRPETHPDVAMVLKVKPQAVLYAFHWEQYLRPGGASSDALHSPPPCCKTMFNDDCKYQSPADADDLLRQWQATVKIMTDAGIRVYVVQEHVEDGKFYYVYWLNGQSVKGVPGPVSLQAFRALHRPLMTKIEAASRAAGATLLDLSDNLCWDDQCFVTNGQGEPLYADSNHIRAFTARTYLSVLDQVVTTPPKQLALPPLLQMSAVPAAAPATSETLNPSRETQVQATTYLQAVQGGKDMNTVWEKGLAFLNAANGLVVVLGDSHADMIKPRFLKLYQDAVKANQPFPTMVFKTDFGRAPLACEAATDADFAMVKALKPQVVFYSFHWLQYLRPDAAAGTPDAAAPRCCKSLYEACPYQTPGDADELLRRWKGQVRELVALGIRVFVAQQYVENAKFYYVYWIEGNKVKAVSPPVNRTEFEATHDHLLAGVAAAVRDANATLINFSDNLCWNGVCRVVNGHGEPLYADDNHIRAYTVRNYVSVVDQVVAAATRP